MRVEYVAFPKRADRSAYVAARFRPYLSGRVLDVGCDQAVLRQLLPEADYTGVDISGSPDIRLDLSRVDRLPFDDASFHAVLCTDVLEHLDNLHGLFGELVRVTGKHLIVSLPNCWAGARKPLRRGTGAIAHYGLPSEPPPDRHRWFFSLSEAEAFLQGQADRHQLQVLEMHATEKPRWLPVRWLRRLLVPRADRYLNLYAHTLWVVYEKTPTDAGSAAAGPRT
jgi:SAM-dependent methyltransferase